MKKRLLSGFALCAAMASASQAAIVIENSASDSASDFVFSTLNNFTFDDFDASAGDKLVVVVSAESDGTGPGGPLDATLSYAGNALTQASAGLSANGQQFVGIYFLDNPGGSATDDISIDFTGQAGFGANGFGAVAYSLSGTADGSGAAESAEGATDSLITTADNSFVVAGFVANAGGSPVVGGDFTENFAYSDTGSASGAIGSVTDAGLSGTEVTFTVTGGSASRPAVALAEFQAIPEPGTAMLALAGMALIAGRRRKA